MPNYQKMYYVLFNTITNTIRILQDAQKEVEELYLGHEISTFDEEI